MRAKRRAEPLLELAERRRAEVRAVVGVHAAVVAVRLHVVDLVEVEQLACRRRRRRRSSRPARRSRRALAQPLEHAREPVGVDRLQQVVERLDRERVDGVPLVRGDEDDRRRVAPLAHERRRLEPASRPASRRRGRRRRSAGRARARAPRAALAASPTTSTSACAGEQVAQLRPRRRLVVDEQRADHRRAGTSSRTTVPNGNERSRTPSP